jgi:hypothetical protein
MRKFTRKKTHRSSNRHLETCVEPFVYTFQQNKVCSCPKNDHRCSQKFIKREPALQTTRRDSKERCEHSLKDDKRKAAGLKVSSKFYSKPVLNVSNVLGKMNLFNEEQVYANKGVLPNTINPRFNETQRCQS